MSESEEDAQAVRAAPTLVSTSAYAHGRTSAVAGSSRDAANSPSDASIQTALPTYSEASAVSNAAGSVAPESVSVSQASTSGPLGEAVDNFFDIAPRSDSTSFQVGYLGLKGFEAWLKGDVLVKLDTATKLKGRYTRCTIQLQAKEQAPGPATNVQHASGSGTPSLSVVELFSHSLVLWDADKEPTSSSDNLPTVPSVMPFSFPLTPDLPHCVHLRDSSLTYNITAYLFSEDAGKLPHAIKTVPVHLVRYTRPGPLNDTELSEIDGAAGTDEEYSLRPHSWIEQAPTLVYAQINRSIFRRAEPIELRIHIPSPDPTAVSEKGLKLRAVEADLIRIIHVKRHAGTSDEGSNAPHKSAVTAQDTAADPDVHEALLAHSGKLCRFHSKRPVLLRLTLHPPFDRANMPHPHPDHDALASGPVFGRGGGGGCESVSQETLMHRVSFEVRIKVGILGGRGERRDIVLRRSVQILPGAAGALEDLTGDGEEGLARPSALSEKERLKRSEKARMLAQDEHAGGSSSRSPNYANDMLDFGMDDEYDGYEDVGRSLNDWTEAADPTSAAGSSSQGADHAERLEQLRHFLDASEPSAHNDGPPPSLLESRNDLQVEVEVEGVGLAMPRHAFRHPADPYPETTGLGEEQYPPPPPIDAQTDEALSAYDRPPSILEGDSFATFVSHDDPPPPASPPFVRSEPGQMAEYEAGTALHVPGGLAPLDTSSSSLGQSNVLPYESSVQGALGTSSGLVDLSAQHLPLARAEEDGDRRHPSYEAAVSGASARRAEVRSGASQHEPPPYAHGSIRAEVVPSFYEAVHNRASVDLGTPRSASSDRAQRRETLPVSPRGLLAHSRIQSAEYQPPAYATSPHPPSYDA